MKAWYVFHHVATHFAFGTRETAERYLRFLNRNRGADCFTMQEVVSPPSERMFADDNWVPHIVDMDQELAEWAEQH